MTTRTVYVVAYRPIAHGGFGMHGFDHYLHREDAVRRVQELIEEVEGHIFTFFEVKIAGPLADESVRATIKEKYNAWLP